MTGFDIGSRHVGDNAPCLIVAEVGMAHDGSLALAHAYIDAVAAAGADAVKFQCHIAEAESTPAEPWRVRPRWPQDASRYEYWRRTAFSAHWWAGLKDHAAQDGLIFLCSPFSFWAVKLLNLLVPVWKVPSGEITNEAMLREIEATGKPVILSTGMATEVEIHRAWTRFPRCAVLQCTSAYPCPPEQIGLGQLQDLRVFPGPVGLSDHSGTIYAGLAAALLGCDILEVHVKLSPHDQGFDASSSITVEQLRMLVEGVRFIERARMPVSKDAMAAQLEPMRELFMRKHERRVTA